METVGPSLVPSSWLRGGSSWEVVVARGDVFLMITRRCVLACYESLCKYVPKVTQVHMCEREILGEKELADCVSLGISI